jgi:hypothetical protein
MQRDGSKIALPAVVLLHLAVTLAHGAAHVGAAISLGRAGMAFVIVVVQVGPLAGLAFTRVRPIGGALIVAATMGAALLFGLINHFLVPGADHVSQVAPGWRVLFGSTAVLLLLTEAAGVAVGVWSRSRALGRVP